MDTYNVLRFTPPFLERSASLLMAHGGPGRLAQFGPLVMLLDVTLQVPAQIETPEGTVLLRFYEPLRGPLFPAGISLSATDR